MGKGAGGALERDGSGRIYRLNKDSRDRKDFVSLYPTSLCTSVDLHTPGVGEGVISTGIRRLCKSLQAKPNRE